MAKVKNFKVLLVDDVEECLVVLIECLKLVDVELVTALDGAEAHKKIISEQIDLIITDTNMPHMDGIELMQTLRAEGVTTPIILYFSGSVNHPNLRVQELGALGANVVLRKPYSCPELINHVQSFMPD